jgi:hypothetical protein
MREHFGAMTGNEAFIIKGNSAENGQKIVMLTTEYILIAVKRK